MSFLSHPCSAGSAERPTGVDPISYMEGKRMYIDNGMCYTGKYVISQNVADMCEELGIVLTETVAAKLEGFCGKALYKGLISTAPDGIVLALQARKALPDVLQLFTLTPDTYAAWEGWQAATRNAADEKAALEAAVQQAAELVQRLGLSADAITVKTTTPLVKTANEQEVGWLKSLRNDFDACVRSTVNTKALADYIINNVRGVKGDTETGTLDKAEIAIPIPGKRKASGTSSPRSTSTGSGSRVHYHIPTAVASIDWPGSWRKLADKLVAAGTVEKDSNFHKHPALERAARELKASSFAFGSKLVTGGYVLAHLEEFTS